MEENTAVDEKIKAKLLKTFRLDKLCPKCGGFLEVKNEIHCENCKLSGDIIDILEFLDMGVMRLRNKMGISRKQLKTKRITINNLQPSTQVGGDRGNKIPNHLY